MKLNKIIQKYINKKENSLSTSIKFEKVGIYKNQIISNIRLT